MAEIKFQRVSKFYGAAAQAVDGLDLDIADGEFMVLVGPSGCGKTTALRMLAGLEHPSDGEILIDGEPVNDLHPVERDVAMVFQTYALYPQMTVQANLGFGLRMRKLPRAEIDERTKRVARMLRLDGLLDRRPSALSGGQRQRVAMGRAIVREPRVLLMDEPLSNLDAQLRIRMRAEIERLHREVPRTTVYVTHDQVEAMTMGDRVAVMRDGRLQQLAAPSELYDNPANAFVARFIGSPPMNLFQARLLQAERSASLGIGSHELRLPGCAVVAPKNSGVALGIRPEDLVLVDDGASGGLPADVTAVEALGSEVLVHAVIPGAGPLGPDLIELLGGEDEVADVSLGEGQVVIVRLPRGARVRAGDRVHLALDGSRVRLFDACSGESIAVADESPAESGEVGRDRG